MKKLAVILMVCLLLSCGAFSIAAFAASDGYLITEGMVNVRQYPGVETEIIGVLESGEEVYPINFIHTYDGRVWVQVEWEGVDGYISDRYLDYSYYDTPAYNEVYNVSVEMKTTGNVRVREEPFIDSKEVAFIDADKTLNVWTFYTSEDGRVWAEIEYIDKKGNLIEGFVSTKNLEFVNEWPKLGRNMVVIGGYINVRENASIDSDYVGWVCQGDILEVDFYIPTVDGNMWASCSMYGEYLGFVSVDFLRVQ